ncbi:ENV2 protein, partial [Upupa epops]|nr:ENV2 protein [Upupa epops]
SDYNPLWWLIKASYHVLNSTNPNVTEYCCLCYDIRPPFYEAIGVLAKSKLINDSNPTQCIWENESGRRQGLTMQKVSGKRRCIR